MDEKLPDITGFSDDVLAAVEECLLPRGIIRAALLRPADDCIQRVTEAAARRAMTHESALQCVVGALFREIQSARKQLFSLELTRYKAKRGRPPKSEERRLLLKLWEIYEVKVEEKGVLQVEHYRNKPSLVGFTRWVKREYPKADDFHEYKPDRIRKALNQARSERTARIRRGQSGLSAPPVGRN